MNVLKFRLRSKPTRNQAKRWLAANISIFPDEVEGFIGEDVFHGWRFVQADDNVVYFANCIEAGISKQEMLADKCYYG